MSFQDGAAGYAGETDLTISSENLSGTNTRGVTFRGSSELMAFTLAGSYTTKALLYFDLGGSIPSTATIVSAQLDLTVECWNNGQQLNGSYLQSSWDENSAQLGWTSRDDANAWSQPGIGPGDRVAGRSFVIGGLTSAGTVRHSVALDPAQVQAWVANPASNQGILLENPATGVVLRIHSSSASSDRPKLTVTYK